MKDGTAEFKAVDARAAAIFDLIYPVGSIFATTGNAPTLGTWEEIAQGRTLQGADGNHAAGSTIEAGLPNITGSFQVSGAIRPVPPWNVTGACIGTTNGGTASGLSEYGSGDLDFYFNASNSNKIYGSSNTVQPPAYVVHFYRRIA